MVVTTKKKTQCTLPLNRLLHGKQVGRTAYQIKTAILGRGTRQI